MYTYCMLVIKVSSNYYYEKVELQENVMPMTWMFNVSFLFNNQ